MIVNVSSGKSYGITSRNLFGIEVGYGISVSDLTHSVDLARAEKHSFCKRRLTAAAVSQQAYVSQIFGCNISHSFLLLLILSFGTFANIL